jgi:hypothetical protein
MFPDFRNSQDNDGKQNHHLKVDNSITYESNIFQCKEKCLDMHSETELCSCELKNALIL